MAISKHILIVFEFCDVKMFELISKRIHKAYEIGKKHFHKTKNIQKHKF